MTRSISQTPVDFVLPVATTLPLVDAKLLSVANVEYPILADLIRHVVNRSGKRLRPVLTLLAGRPFAFEANVTNLVAMATAMELLHTASLVHDDMIDNASTRRGHSTLNSLWNGGTAVLVGDYLFAKSADIVAETENVQVMTLFARTLMAVCNGELRQLFNGYNWRQTRDDYLQRIHGKTASIFATSTESGAVLAGADSSSIDAMRSYGYHLGMAFQIIDDILDFTASDVTLGKPAGNDLRQGNVTLPALLLMERLGPDNPVRRFLDSGSRSDDLAVAVAAIHESGVIDEAFGIASSFRDRAVASIEGLPPGPVRDSLVALADYVLDRDH